MKTYGVKDHELVRPFQAKNEEEASQKALQILGFKADKLIKEHGAIKTLKLLDFELEIL